MMKLKAEKIYIYYDVPIVFSASNRENDDIFICLFADETDASIKYHCAPVSRDILGELERNEKDVRSVFESPGKKYSVLVNANSRDNLEAIEFAEDVTPFLPEDGLFIGGLESEAVQEIPVSVPWNFASV
jgi:hypothetical protein